MKQKKIFILGAGGWGTAISILLSKNSFHPIVWTYEKDLLDVIKRSRENTIYLPGVKIPEEVEFVNEISENLLLETTLMVMAVPVKYMRGALERFPKEVFKGLPVVSVAKGIENDSLKRPSEIIRDILSATRIAVLSGPSHAEEVARGLPASVVAASEDKDFAREIQKIFNNERFRVYTSDDTTGVELGGALKNIIAIAAGICDGLRLGDNAKSALLTRGIVEIARLGVAMGGKRETFFGLSGIGDLITTSMSPYGRNRDVGMRIGRGEKAKEIIASMKQVAEGIWTAKSVYELAKKYKVDMPISIEIYKVIFEGKNPSDAVRDLMTRQLKDES